jgi:predicted TIM-barrel fold metal-dependent hydrolase
VSSAVGVTQASFLKVGSGPDGLLFGSNFPIDKPNATLPDLVGMLADIMCTHSDPAVVQKVFHDNAIRMLGVGASLPPGKEEVQ